jgi:hypothetical protein
MNKINQSQNKQNNNKYKYMTIQSIMNKRVYNACIYGASSIGMDSKISQIKKKTKEGSKTQNPMDPNQLLGSHANAAKHLCHRA